MLFNDKSIFEDYDALTYQDLISRIDFFLKESEKVNDETSIFLLRIIKGLYLENQNLSTKHDEISDANKKVIDNYERILTKTNCYLEEKKIKEDIYDINKNFLKYLNNLGINNLYDINDLFSELEKLKIENLELLEINKKTEITYTKLEKSYEAFEKFINFMVNKGILAKDQNGHIKLSPMTKNSLNEYKKSKNGEIITKQFFSYTEQSSVIKQSEYKISGGDNENIVNENITNVDYKLEVLKDIGEYIDLFNKMKEELESLKNKDNNKIEKLLEEQKKEYEKALEEQKKEYENALEEQKKEYENALLENKEEIISLKNVVKLYKSSYITSDTKKLKK